MKARTGLGIGAAALAWLCFSPDAHATGQPQPNNNISYSAETVALSPGGNTVRVQSLFYITVNGAATLTTGSNVGFFCADWK